MLYFGPFSLSFTSDNIDSGGEGIQVRQLLLSLIVGQCTHWNISQNAPDCILAHIHFKIFPGGMSSAPPKKLVAFGHSGLLSQTINPR